MTVLNRHLLLPDLQWKSIAAFRTIRHFTWDPSMAFKQRYVRIWHWSCWGFKRWSCIFTTSYIITVCFSWLQTLEVFFKYPEDPWDSSVRGDCLSVSVSLKKCLFNFARLSLTLNFLLIVNCFRKLYRTVHFIIYIRSQLVVKLPWNFLDERGGGREAVSHSLYPDLLLLYIPSRN